MNSLKKNFIVDTTEVDPKQNYKAYSFLSSTQEAASNHANTLGFGYNQLIKENYAWVLSRQRVVFQRVPKWQEKVSMTTWHKGMNGIFAIRDFILESEEGSPLILSTSSWLIINLETRRMQRTENIFGVLANDSINRRDAIPQTCEKLISPKNLEFCRKHTVLYSDLDMNLHTNNAKYLEWALDCIPAEILLNREIAEFQINFSHETRINDNIDLYLSSPSDNSFFVEGKNGETLIFQIIIKLKP